MTCLKRPPFAAPLIALSLFALGAGQVHAAAPQTCAHSILETSGVQGGLVVLIDCAEAGALAQALSAEGPCLVHVLDADLERVMAVRADLAGQGVYGAVSAEWLQDGHLPYTDGLVQLVVDGGPGAASREEIMRVLSPGGVLCAKEGEAWTATVKPRPAALDDWTHALYDATNNAVSKDTVVGPPQHIQWIGGPPWARSHDHLSSVSAVVSSGGRVFSISDYAPAAAVALPAQWRLVAQDAFSGVVLWRRDIGPWEGHLRGFRSGPAAIQRRLVAVGDAVYVTLGYGKPVVALDAATGEIQHTYAESNDALEFICAGGVLYVVTGPALSHGAASSTNDRERREYFLAPGGKALSAIDAESGKLLWKKADDATSQIMPMALATDGKGVYFQNTEEVVALEPASGDELWRAPRPATRNRWAWAAPTLVAYDGVVLSADRDAASKVEDADVPEGQVLWSVYSMGGEAPGGAVMAFSAETGEKLWETPAKECYNAPIDVLVADGLVWTGELVKAKEPGITRGLNPHTGEVARTRPPDSEFFNPGMGHHRCHRNKATENYLVLGRSGVEWIDVKTGVGLIDHWIRGACQYGVMLANGLLYVPPHSCACYTEAKLHGFIALTPSRLDVGAEDAPQLAQGPAYGFELAPAAGEGPWPTYRGDNERSGRLEAAIGAELDEAWQTKLGGELTSLVVDNSRVYVAHVQQHTLHALDVATGAPVWRYVAGGRIDAPPTIYRGLCLFGCRDGYVYALRASDGALAWRFRAAPQDRRIVAYGQLESAWPVHGNVLVRGGSAYFVAGRTSFVDGGLHLYRLDPATGAVQAHKRIDSRDPKTGLEPQDNVQGVYMPGIMPDVLSSNEHGIYTRQQRFTESLELERQRKRHLFCQAGFIDGSWWHRTYWMYGDEMSAGWGGWGKAGYRFPAGRIMALGGDDVFAFGRLHQYGTHGAHAGLDPSLHPWGDVPEAMPEYVVFACSREPELTHIKDRKERFATRIVTRWIEPCNMWVRAMALAGDRLILAGTPDPVTAADLERDPFAPEAPGVLRVVAADTGKVLAERAIGAPPAWDAMALAPNTIYVATTDGVVSCLKAK